MEYHSNFSSPLGVLLLTSDGVAITGITFSDHELPLQNSCEVLDQCSRQLEEYFSGNLTVFNLPLNPAGTDFQKKVWSELLKIPYSETMTYMELSVRLGDAKSIRAVGTANGRNPIAIVIPCHRVIGAGNKLTGYAGGIWRKKALLELELTYHKPKYKLF